MSALLQHALAHRPFSPLSKRTQSRIEQAIPEGNLALKQRRRSAASVPITSAVPARGKQASLVGGEQGVQDACEAARGGYPSQCACQPAQ